MSQRDGLVTADDIKCIYCGRTFKTWQGLGSHYHHRHAMEQGCPSEPGAGC